MNYPTRGLNNLEPADPFHESKGGLHLVEKHLSSKIGEGVVVTTAHVGQGEAKIVYVNRAFTEITGYSSEEVVGKSAKVLLGPGTDFRSIASLRRAFRKGKLWKGENIHRRKDGRKLHVHWRIEPIRNPEGRITHFLCIQRDRTAEREAKKARLESEAKYRSIFENAVFGIFQTTGDGHYLRANPALAKIYGYDSSEELVNHLTRIETQLYVKPERRAEFISTLRSKGEVRHFESEVYRKDGSIIWISESAREVRDEVCGELLYYEGMVEDITEQKSLEAQLLRSQRVESIGMLASGMAHDLGNVLSPILMAVSYLKSRHEDPTSDKVLEVVESSVQKATALVRQVVAFARGTEGDHKLVDLGNLITELIAMVRCTLPKAMDIRVAPGLADFFTIGDETQLYQVFLNLIVNARDAMNGEGSVSIEVSRADISESINRGSFRISSGKYIRVDVADTGCGISPEAIEKIFTPFFTTKEIGKGTGLGLSTVMAIVQNHRGAIDVRSVEGAGTTFSLYFPRCEESLVSSAAPSLPLVL